MAGFRCPWRPSGKFVKREPQTVRFRLEPNRAETLASRQERETAYGELGWRSAAALGDYRVWYCDDPDAPELYTDPATLGWAWDRQLSRVWRNGLICVLLILLWTVWQFRQIWAATRWRNSCMGCGPSGCSSCGGAAALWDTVRQLRAVRGLRRKLDAGVAPDHTGDVNGALRREAAPGDRGLGRHCPAGAVCISLPPPGSGEI